MIFSDWGWASNLVQRLRNYDFWKSTLAARNYGLNRMKYLLTSEFELNWREIRGNFEHQSQRGFHKLSREGGNSELWYRTKKPWSVEVDRSPKIQFQDWVNSKLIFWSFLLVINFHYMIDFQSSFLDAIWRYVAMTTSGPICPHSLNIDDVCIVGGKITLILVVSYKQYDLAKHGLRIYRKHYKYIYTYITTYPSSDARAFNAAWTMLHML
jgi:hypothetical protein